MGPGGPSAVGRRARAGLWLLALAVAATPRTVGEEPPPAADEARPAVAVLRLGNPGENAWLALEGIRRAQDTLGAALEAVAGERYRVVDRATVDDRMQREGLLLPPGPLSPAGAVKIGRVLGIRYLVTGTVSEYGAGPKEGRRRALGLLWGRDFVVELTLRMFDSTDGRMVWADSARAAAPPADDWVQAERDEADAVLFERLFAPMLEELGSALGEAAF